MLLRSHRTHTGARPHVHALVLLALASACAGNAPVDEDAGPLDRDAGSVDAGALYEGPPYDVEVGFFADDTLARTPWRCDAPPYRWWGVSQLGDVLEHQVKGTFSTSLLAAFKAQLATSIALARSPAHDVGLHRIRYQTQDRGTLVDATALVAVPVAPAAEMPVLLYMHGTEGFVDVCSPSSGIDTFTQRNYVDAATLAMFASWGYIVVAPDYLGLKSFGAQSPDLHPYLVAEPTALAALDAVRASKRLTATLETAPAPTGPLVVLGVSQGGHGAAFVVRYQPHYAHDLPIAGAVYAVPPLDLVGESAAASTSTSATVRGSSGAFLATGRIWYRSEVPLSDALLPPHDENLLLQLYTECNTPSLSGAVESIFSEPLRAGALEPFACMGSENSLLHTSVPKRENTPALIILADSDVLVSRVAEREAFVSMCDADDEAALELIECSDAGHIEGFTYSIDNAFDWLDARMAGLALTTRCEPVQPAKCASDPR
jgi:dienelactone hydrolase